MKSDLATVAHVAAAVCIMLAVVVALGGAWLSYQCGFAETTYSVWVPKIKCFGILLGTIVLAGILGVIGFGLSQLE